MQDQSEELHVRTAVTQQLPVSSIGSLDFASLVRGDTISHLPEKTAWAHTEHTLNIDSNQFV